MDIGQINIEYRDQHLSNIPSRLMHKCTLMAALQGHLVASPNQDKACVNYDHECDQKYINIYLSLTICLLKQLVTQNYMHHHKYHGEIRN